MVIGVQEDGMLMSALVSFFDAENNELLLVEHVVRKLSLHDKYGSYRGASSSMDGAGIEAGMLTFVEDGINIHGVVHDHDGETMKIIQKYYPAAIEMNDPAHRVKLFKKIISLGSLHKQLKRIGNKCSRMLMYAIRHCDGQQLANFKQLMMNQFNHITNRDHSCCTHDVDYIPRNGFITDERARGLLWLEFEKIISIGEKYVENYGTNTAEAFNHEITKFCPKSINFHSTYVLRANLAALARVSPKYNWKSWMLFR